MALSRTPFRVLPGRSFDHGRNLRSFNWLYGFHHAQRFKWLTSKIASLGRPSLSIIELGCNDATSLDYVPVRVHRYVGFDAGWRSGWKDGLPSGLEAARTRYGHRTHFEFRESSHPSDLAGLREKFDVGIILETFEYLEATRLQSYVATLADKLNDDGCILSTMPNEKGIPLLVKTVGAQLSGVRRSQYTSSQFLDALLGRMDRVPRAERGRKGFDYAAMARLVAKYLPHVHLESVGLPKLPLCLSLNVGLVASKHPAPVAQSRPSPSLDRSQSR